MKRCINGSNVLIKEGKVIGISLGFDFAAEHEWGTDQLKDRLGMPKEVKSWKDYLVKKDVYSGPSEFEDLTTFISTLNKSRIKPYLTRNSDKFLNCWWDQKNFLISFKWENTPENDYDIELDRIFKEKNMMIATGPIMDYLNNDFEVSGLVFVDSTKIPKDVLMQINNKIKANKNLQKNVEKSGILKEVKAKQNEWKKQYPQSMNTPWDYFALSPREKSDQNTVYDFVFWLNPRHQDVLHSGWFTVEDVKDWLNEEGKIIGEGWDRLKFECKNSPFYAFNYEYKNYNFHPIRHMRTWRKDGYNDTKLLKTKLDNSMIEKIEGHIKWIIKDHIEIKNYYKLGKVPIGEIDFNIDRNEEDRIFGFFEALDFYGVGTFEAVNTPKTRENFSWWKEILRSETMFELVKECYPDEIKKEWYETKKD